MKPVSRVNRIIPLVFIFLVVCIGSTMGQENHPFVLDSAKYGPGKVYTNPEKEAYFPGGYEMVQEYFRIRFNAYAEDPDVVGGPKNGFVEALFVVEPNGKIKHVQILQSYTYQYDQEMISTLTSMPKWKPATIGGVPVRSFQKYRYSIRFISN